MNRKEIIAQNLRQMNLTSGKPIKGKGTEIFGPARNVFYGWAFNNNKEGIKELLDDIKDEDIKTLFVSEIRYNDEYFNFSKDPKLARKTFSLKKLIKSNFEGVDSIYIYKEPQLLGYLPLSKYTSSYDDQLQLIQDVLAFEEREVYGEIVESSWDLEDMELKRDHEAIHGAESYVQDTYDCHYVDGRLSNYNDSVVDDFWRDPDESGWFKELDPDEKTSIYHRKGKDWYIGFSLSVEEGYVTYRDEDGELREEEYYTFVSCSTDTETVERVRDAVKSMKNDIEVRGFINNELRIGGYYSGSYDYNSNYANKHAVELLFGDNEWELKYLIEDTLESWELETIPTEFVKAYNKVMMSKVAIGDDLKVTINDEKYNHLKILKALEKKFDYELVHSVVSDSIDTASWAIKKDDEEYHFNIVDVIADDVEDAISLKEFLRSALLALEKRKIEKLSQAELFEKAKHVFVGIQDSIASGNCEFGTRQFIVKHHIDTSKIGGIRGDVLLEMELSNFTKRAVMQAYSHQSGFAA